MGTNFWHIFLALKNSICICWTCSSLYYLKSKWVQISKLVMHILLTKVCFPHNLGLNLLQSVMCGFEFFKEKKKGVLDFAKKKKKKGMQHNCFPISIRLLEVVIYYKIRFNVASRCLVFCVVCYCPFSRVHKRAISLVIKVTVQFIGWQGMGDNNKEEFMHKITNNVAECVFVYMSVES